MSKQTLVIETAKELSLNNGMIIIMDIETGEMSLRPLEDVQMIMIDHHSASVRGNIHTTSRRCWNFSDLNNSFYTIPISSSMLLMT